MKGSKLQECPGGLVHETGKGSTRIRKITVKKGQGKGPGDFCNIVPALVPQPTTQGLFLAFPEVAFLRGSTSFN